MNSKIEKVKMKKNLFFLILMIHAQFVFSQNFKKDSSTLKQISNHILTNYECYRDLEYLCKQIGNRISGSSQAAQAVEWGKKALENAGCDRVYLQEVMVPHWVRGEEKAEMINSKGMRIPIKILAVGNSIGTGSKGIEAPIVMFDNIDQLHRMGPQELKGKIAYFNYHFDQTNINTFDSYGPCVYYRWAAPSEASKKGAIAIVIRSVSSAFDEAPHTGSLSYDKNTPAIPAVAISNLAADRLSKQISTEGNVKMYIKTMCQMLPDVLSYNVIGEIKGSELPDEIITIGGHLDSWDVGEGAHDDGAGIVQSIEVMRTFKKLGIKPKRTVRAVLFMNEENGLRGGTKYAEEALKNKERHIIAIESDLGGATPLGFSLEMNQAQKNKIKSWQNLLFPYGIYNLERTGGGADISPLHKKLRVPMMELIPDSQRYFDMHHCEHDVFENIHRRELCLGAIAISAMTYLLSTYGL